MFRCIAGAFLLVLVLTGCRSAGNNYLEARDFADYLKRDGVPVSNVRQIPADPFHASSAVAILVGDSEIGVYKYDRNSELQRKKLERIEKTGRTYITGIPYPAKVYGSFMIFGLEKNKHKRAILKTLSNFR
ncbi:MAG: hypothetical protein IJU70_12775 [Lentisphaeria bacterium]|nr:hypothetical protein [Lentisphaeria bacterium]